MREDGGKTVPQIHQWGDKELRGKRVLVRVDGNVPLVNGHVADDFRLRSILPTLAHLKNHGAITLLISHIGRSAEDTLEPVYEYLRKKMPIDFEQNLFLDETRIKIGRLSPGAIVLFENLRKYKGETENDISFARKLAGLADRYVNEAFSVSHREHASIVSVPTLLPSAVGLSFAKELTRLRVLEHPPKPFLLILGGAKFETKIPFIEKSIKLADRIFLGGAIMHPFIKFRGGVVGESLMPEKQYSFATLAQNQKVHVPREVIVQADKKDKTGSMVDVEKVGPHEVIVDIGRVYADTLAQQIRNSKFILWNGSLGNCEAGFCEGTRAIANAIAKSGVQAIIGGGDTLAVARTVNFDESRVFFSTGGGALLHYMLEGTLPGIEALRK